MRIREVLPLAPTADGPRAIPLRLGALPIEAMDAISLETGIAQLTCRTEGHYADRCDQRYTRYDSSAHLAEAFNQSCSISANETLN